MLMAVSEWLQYGSASEGHPCRVVLSPLDFNVFAAFFVHKRYTSLEIN